MNNATSPLRYKDVPDPATMQRIPERPLGKLSDFVCTALPDLCLSIERGDIDRSKLARSVEQAVGATTTDVRQFVRDKKMLAFLDCGMSEATLGRFQLPPPDNLRHLTEELAQSTGQAPGLRYEPLIRSNPLYSDPRLFSLKHGKGEIVFYDVHRRIERIAVPGIQKIRSILATLATASANSQPKIEANIDEVVFVTDGIRDELQTMIDELPLEDFTGIRAYFNNASRIATGPSGKDSAGIFVIDALTTGDDPAMATFLEHKMETKGFYPTSTADADGFAGQADMDEALTLSRNNHTLVTLSKRFPFLEPAVKRLLGSMHALRAKHMAVGKRFLPDAFKPDAPVFVGTGGVGDFPTYLKIPIGILQRMKSE
jgi:hypothetical protein